jgi:hypothetical protein
MRWTLDDRIKIWHTVVMVQVLLICKKAHLQPTIVP